MPEPITLLALGALAVAAVRKLRGSDAAGDPDDSIMAPPDPCAENWRVVREEAFARGGKFKKQAKMLERWKKAWPLKPDWKCSITVTSMHALISDWAKTLGQMALTGDLAAWEALLQGDELSIRFSGERIAKDVAAIGDQARKAAKKIQDAAGTIFGKAGSVKVPW